MTAQAFEGASRYTELVGLTLRMPKASRIRTQPRRRGQKDLPGYRSQRRPGRPDQTAGLGRSWKPRHAGRPGDPVLNANQRDAGFRIDLLLQCDGAFRENDFARRPHSTFHQMSTMRRAVPSPYNNVGMNLRLATL